ncbi:MAG TPA: hypothetical protein VEW71_02905 [Allosphingosinicella sp.]|nr:hypothetical protein [Allosphingosinicella sp.]
MITIYVTDGDRDTIIEGVALTVHDYSTPDGDHTVFGDISQGYQRRMDVDLATLDGLLSGAGVIGYFSEAALAKPRPGADVPLLVEMIAAGARHDVVIPPLFSNSPDNIAGLAAPRQLSLEEQQALFVRVLGKDWTRQVQRLLKARGGDGVAGGRAGDGESGAGEAIEGGAPQPG